MATRILITGCRDWKCHALAIKVLGRIMDRYGPCTIVHGAARGVDVAFHEAAIELGHGIEPHPADWQQHGKGAGPKRNAAMVAAGAQLCIAVHRNIWASKGTKDCARRAIAAGIPTWLIDSDQGEPRRLKVSDLETTHDH